MICKFCSSRNHQSRDCPLQDRTFAFAELITHVVVAKTNPSKIAGRLIKSLEKSDVNVEQKDWRRQVVTNLKEI